MSGAHHRRQHPEAGIPVGFVFARGKTGYEAFNRDERSVGVFKTQREAAAALGRVS
jgi:hypothetical protein